MLELIYIIGHLAQLSTLPYTDAPYTDAQLYSYLKYLAQLNNQLSN